MSPCMAPRRLQTCANSDSSHMWAIGLPAALIVVVEPATRPEFQISIPPHAEQPDMCRRWFFYCCNAVLAACELTNFPASLSTSSDVYCTSSFLNPF